MVAVETFPGEAGKSPQFSQHGKPIVPQTIDSGKSIISKGIGFSSFFHIDG